MTQLKTNSGKTLFNAVVETKGVELHREGDKVFAVLDGKKIGVVRVTDVMTYVKPNTKGKSQRVKISELQGDIDPKELIGKDPTTLTAEELIALTTYLQELAGKKVAGASDEAPKGKKNGKKPAPVDEDDEEDDEDFEEFEDDEDDEDFEDDADDDEEEDEEDDEDEDEDSSKLPLPKKYKTYEDIAGVGVKALWAEVGKAIAAKIGINARTKKDDMVAAIAEYYGLTPEGEEAPKAKPSKKDGKSSKASKVVEDDEEFEDDEEDFDEEDEDFDDEDEDEEDFDDEDEEDFDEDEDEEDEDEDDYEDDEDDYEDDDDDEDYEDDEDEDDEDEEDEITEEDVDALFESGSKSAIVAFCKEHRIPVPQRKLSADKVKQIIKDHLFGEDDE